MARPLWALFLLWASLLLAPEALADLPPPDATASDTPAPAPRIETVQIAGHPHETPERLARFLGLVPGATLDDDLEDRVEQGLEALGYLVPEPLFTITPRDTPGQVGIRLEVEPARLVRHIRVRGNWPVLRAIFNEDILRRMTLRPGSRLPDDDAAVARILAEEGDRVRQYLFREGFFKSDAEVLMHKSTQPEWVDLDVAIYLGPWFNLEHICAESGPGKDADKQGAAPAPEGEKAQPPGPAQEPKPAAAPGKATPDKAPCLKEKWLKEVEPSFRHTFPPYFWSRFRIDRMHEDARRAERHYRELGYPAARVFPVFDRQNDIDRKDKKVRLRLRVVKKGRVDVHFAGNAHISDKELREKVTLFSSGSYDETELVESARELHRYYQTNGYLEAQVEYVHQRRREADTNEDVHDITFLIKEGPELRVAGVDFVSETGEGLHIDSETLQRQIVTKKFPIIGRIGLGEGGYVTSVQLAQDVEKLAAFYRSKGFMRAQVRGEIVRDRRAFGSAGVLGADVAAGWPEDQRIYVRFYIDEGTVVTLARLEFRFQGPHGRDNEELKRVLKESAGVAEKLPYVPEQLSAGLKRIVQLYATSGHPYATLTPREVSAAEFGGTVPADAATAPNRLYVIVEVDEGPAVRFGEILVRGNFRTAEWVIRRDLPFQTGDLYDISKIDQATRNLQNHQVFNSVRVTSVPAALPPGMNPVPILVEVQERYDNWGNVEASVGYATDVGLLASLGYFWGNVFGGGGQIEARGDVALDVIRQAASSDVHSPFYRLLGLTIRYVHPHLWSTRLRGELSAFGRKEATPALGEVISVGGRATLTWTPRPSLRLFGRFELTTSSLASIDLQRTPTRGDAQQDSVNDATTIGKLTAGVLYDRRTSLGGAKNPLLPAAGSLVALQWSVSPFFAHRFITVSGQAQHFQPLIPGRGLTLIANLRFDWGIPIGEPALPAVERFFAGGDQRTRGYDTDRLRTEVIRTGVSPVTGADAYRVVPQGGNVRFLGTLELQFPIGTLGSIPWAGALFVDAGTVFDDPFLFNFRRDVKFSVGISLLRLLTPLGALSFEYAYPITQTVAEQEWKRDPWYLHWPGRIHFNWGIPILR
ncbi:MAG TPA: POTRA domain-containing protein [Polyangia bacterium]|nr:POTRA domain-containing protein [Polyangia bacterium]